MKDLKKFLSKFDTKVLKKYFFISLVMIVVIIILSKIEITKAKYETSTNIAISPNFAFFIVDVTNQTHSFRLDNIVPSSTPYTYVFNVSNFQDTKKANVDLTYSIEVITTTNLPLNIRVYKGTDLTVNTPYTDFTTTNSDGVYFRHLLFSGVSTMYYNTMQTDTYTLWIEFPERYKNTADGYAGVIELIDVEIKAEQVVGSP